MLVYRHSKCYKNSYKTLATLNYRATKYLKIYWSLKSKSRPVLMVWVPSICILSGVHGPNSFTVSSSIPCSSFNAFFTSAIFYFSNSVQLLHPEKINRRLNPFLLSSSSFEFTRSFSKIGINKIVLENIK